MTFPACVVTHTITKRIPAKQRLTLVDEEAGPSSSRAPIQVVIIPAIVKPSVGFHNPHTFLPQKRSAGTVVVLGTP